jgi:hypothetical protein
MSRRARISRIEELIASKLDARQERRKQWEKALPIHARRHATAVAAIVLAGEPKIDEPLIRPWARSLRHYKIAIDPTTASEQIGQLNCWFQSLLGNKHHPRGLLKYLAQHQLQFTRTVLDAWIIRFHLPEMKPNPNWGSAGLQMRSVGHFFQRACCPRAN